MRFIKHPDIDTPHGSTTVWRYMGLDKFLDLITHRRIFFTNAANFTDGYEVSLPLNIVKAKRTQLISQGLSGPALEEKLVEFEYHNRPLRHLTLVNCWSIGRTESYALWKIYLGGAKAGVAIRTTLSRVRKSIISAANDYPEDIYCGLVQYQDYLPEKELSRYRLVTTKREYYSYEQELRLFILHYPRAEGDETPPYNQTAGRHVSVDLESLIDKIYVSPFVAPWFGDSLNEILLKVAPALAQRLTISSIRDQ